MSLLPPPLVEDLCKAYCMECSFMPELIQIIMRHTYVKCARCDGRVHQVLNGAESSVQCSQGHMFTECIGNEILMLMSEVRDMGLRPPPPPKKAVPAQSGFSRQVEK